MSDEPGHGAGDGKERQAPLLGAASAGDPAGEDRQLRPDAEVRTLLEATDLRDRIAEIRDGPLKARSREIATLLLVALVFALLGAMVGTPVYVIAAVVTIWTVVPITRRMALTDRLRRLERELVRVEGRLLRAAAERAPAEAERDRRGDPDEGATRGLDRSGDQDFGRAARDPHP